MPDIIHQNLRNRVVASFLTEVQSKLGVAPPCQFKDPGDMRVGKTGSVFADTAREIRAALLTSEDRLSSRIASSTAAAGV